MIDNKYNIKTEVFFIQYKDSDYLYCGIIEEVRFTNSGIEYSISFKRNKKDVRFSIKEEYILGIRDIKPPLPNCFFNRDNLKDCHFKDIKKIKDKHLQIQLTKTNKIEEEYFECLIEDLKSYLKRKKFIKKIQKKNNYE